MIERLPILISYAYSSHIDWGYVREHREFFDLLIDSGAYTAFKQNKPVQVKEYMQWLETITDLRPTGYFTLDVIGDQEATRKNYLTMTKAGFKPIPIITKNCDQKHVHFYQDKAEYLGIGGLFGDERRYLDWLMPNMVDHRVHLLGYTRHDELIKHAPYSSDSSNWKGGAMYGRFSLYTGLGFKAFTRKSFWRFADQIIDLGFDPDVLRGDAEWGSNLGAAHAISTASYIRYVRRLYRLRKSKLYLAVVKKLEVELLVDILKKGR